MGMTIDEAISHLDTYSSTMGSGQTTQEQHEDAKRVAIATMRKYQKLEQEPTTNKDLGVDCVARKDVERYIEGFINEYTPREELEFINLELDGLKHIPSVTPQEPQTFKWCTDCKEYDQEKHCCHRYSKVIRDTVEEMKEVYIKREVLDKIKEQIKSNLRGVEITLEVLNENHPLRPKMNGAKDTLEDCLELIDKAESEG